MTSSPRLKAGHPHGKTVAGGRRPRAVYAFRGACMHPYASGDAYRKSPEKARKPLYIKGKTEFLSLVCIVCINIRGFFPFSRILYKGMMHTMHTRPRTIPGTSETSRNGKKRCMHPLMHTDAYSPPGMHTRPGAGIAAPHERLETIRGPVHGVRLPVDDDHRRRGVF